MDVPFVFKKSAEVNEDAAFTSFVPGVIPVSIIPAAIVILNNILSIFRPLLLIFFILASLNSFHYSINVTVNVTV